jgi:transcriptional regulator GlxA family with amidase domain
MNDPNGYADRVQRVVDYLAEHLDEALDLEALARVACFRPITSTAFTARCSVKP